MKSYLLARLREASTWRGLIMIATAVGLKVQPEVAESIIAVGISVVGAVGAAFPDKK